MTDTQKIQQLLHQINNKLREIDCNLDDLNCDCEGGDSVFGFTELNPPVDAPLEGETTVRLNVAEGILFYWDGDSWESFSTGSSPSYSVYTALLSQTGTNAPVPTILEDTTTGITWNYDSVGFYYATISGGFDITKTAIFGLSPNGAYNGFVTGRVSVDIDSGILYIYVQNSGGIGMDDWNAPLTIEIRIYP